MTDEEILKEIAQSAQVRAVGARMTPRAAMEQAADVIEALTLAVQASIDRCSGTLEEVERFRRRLLTVAEEQER